MNKPDYIPHDYHRIKLAETWEELSWSDYDKGENAILLPRTLSENFTALAQDLYAIHRNDAEMKYRGRIHLDTSGDDAWWTHPGVEHHEAAIAVIRRDIEMMQDRPRATVARLRLVAPQSYTDFLVHDFHVDGADDDKPWEHLMCCYNLAATEIARNEDVYMRLDCGFMGQRPPPTFDLDPDAKTFSFKPGDMWRQRSYYRGSVDPFVHRAPVIPGNMEARMLSIGDYDL